MSCSLCGWEIGTGGTLDPCEIVVMFEDHLFDHVEEMLRETGPCR